MLLSSSTKPGLGWRGFRQVLPSAQLTCSMSRGSRRQVIGRAGGWATRLVSIAPPSSLHRTSYLSKTVGSRYLMLPGLPRWCSCKEPACRCRRCKRCHGFDPWVRKIPWSSPGVDPIHSSILAWEISWTEEPGRLWESQEVRHD